jgi:Putative Actinobacterial Holin-X, holin superfamily III
MADQASMRINGPASDAGRTGLAPPTGDRAASGAHGSGAGPVDVVTNIAEFGDNLLTLTELQARLAALELKQNVAAVKIGTAFVVAGAVLAITSVPIALFGLAELLVSELGMRRGFALLAVAASAFAVAGTCITIAVARLRGSDVGFPLTAEEFARNLNWVRTVLVHSGRSSSKRGAR